MTNDGVHVYREWGILRQDLSPAVLARTDFRRAAATEIISQSKAEKTRLALAVTATKAYYGLAVAQRKYATAQQVWIKPIALLPSVRAWKAAGESRRTAVASIAGTTGMAILRAIAGESGTHGNWRNCAARTVGKARRKIAQQLS